MKIPVLEGQQMIGGVSIREEGLYRVISARVGLRPGVQRLWLCSGTQGACLGVLAPEAGFLRLEKPRSLGRAARSADARRALRPGAARRRSRCAALSAFPDARGERTDAVWAALCCIPLLRICTRSYIMALYSSKGA